MEQSSPSTLFVKGNFPSENAKPYYHLPDPERIGGKKIRESKKEASKTTTEEPHTILADAYDGTPEDVQANLPTKVTLKRTIQKTRRKEALSVNPQLALANDISLLTFHITDDFLQSWKYFDSGPGTDRMLILTTDPFLDILCEAVWIS